MKEIIRELQNKFDNAELYADTTVLQIKNYLYDNK